MVSDPAAAEAIRLVAAAASLFAGLSVSSVARPLVSRSGRGAAGTGPCIAAAVAASCAVACGAWLFVAMARRGSAPELAAWYAVAGLAVGLLSGLFPRAVGVPVLTVAALTAAVAVAGLAPLAEWSDGAEAARLTAYPAGDGTVRCTVRMAAPRGLSVERDIELPPGPVELEFDVVEIRGPLTLAFGLRRFRLVAIIAGQARIAGVGVRLPFMFRPDGGRPALLVARLLGCSAGTTRTAPFTPEYLVPSSFTMLAGGGFGPAGR